MDSQYFPLSEKESKKAGIMLASEKNKAAGFPSRLRQLRKEANISQQRLANELGVTKSTIGLYETGDNVPDAKTLYKLAQYYNVSADFLLGLTGDPSRKPAAADELGLSPRAIDRIQNLNRNCRVYNYEDSFEDGEYTDVSEMLSLFIESESFNHFMVCLAEAIYYEKRSEGDTNLILRRSDKPVTQLNDNAIKAATQSLLAWEELRSFIWEVSKDGEYQES